MLLKNLLAELVRQAELKPGAVKRTGRLMHGLGIAIRFDQAAGTLAVQLDREKTWPGDREWRTVIGCLPPGFVEIGELKHIPPDPARNIHAYYLRGSLRREE